MGRLTFSHGGNVHYFLWRGRKRIIDFSANINPLGLPKMAKKIINKNLDEILRYPDVEAKNITHNIARYWRIDERNVLLGNGSVALIYLITQTFKPKVTFIPMPTFSEYERAAKNTGSRIRFLSLKEKDNFRINSSLSGKVDLFFLCNPNNPTGNLILENRWLPERIKYKLLVVDEAFMDFVPDQLNHTFIRNAVKTTKIAVLRTFTKFFALPGLRIGYVVAHKDIIDKLKQNQLPWSVNSLAQLAAKLMLADKNYAKQTYSFIEREKKFLYAKLAEIKTLRLYESKTNFFLVKIEKSGISSTNLQETLIRKNILVRDCANFRNLRGDYIRLAIRTHRENLALLTALKKAL